jgi:hypothetical protein
LSTPSAPRWVRHSYLSKVLRYTPYTCGHHTTITIGNGKIAIFWDLPWLEGEKPKDIAPLIFEISKKKRCTMAQALHCKSWVTNIKMDANLTVQPILEYLRL